MFAKVIKKTIPAALLDRWHCTFLLYYNIFINLQDPFLSRLSLYRTHPA